MRAWVRYLGIAAALAAGCGTPAPQLVAPGGDAPGDDTPGDGAGADPDAPPGDAPDGMMPDPDLVAMCGAVPVTLDDWERCYRKRKCEWELNCVPLTTYGSVQECIDLGDAFEGGRLAFEALERKRAVAMGRASLNVARFTRCLAETSASRCNTALHDPSCATRFDGTIADAGACYTDVECSSPGAVCTSTCADACCVGACTPKFEEGATCTEIRSCEPGFQCPRNRICIAGDIDTPCTTDRDCDPNAWCDIPAGRCRADLAVGATCTSVLQCGGETSCVAGKCSRVTEPGDKCEGTCNGNLACIGGACRLLAPLNAGCSLALPCAGIDTMCSGGVCVLRGDVGASCAPNTCRAGLFCTSELSDPSPKCAARRPSGQPCAAADHCQSYLCSGTSQAPGVCLAWAETCP